MREKRSAPFLLRHVLPSNGLAVQHAVNIDDLRQLAERRVPRAVFDYIDGGADGEVTLRENRHSWEEMLLIKDGEIEVSVNGHKQHAGPGALVFFEISG